MASSRLPPGEIPFVSHDGGITRYYADRFYLDAPTASTEYSDHNNDNCNEPGYVSRRSKNAHSNYCNKCGEKLRQQETNGSSNNSHTYWPPLFDRAKFINSLDLSAAIIATFSIGDLEFLSEEFPRLFPPQRSRKNHRHVPTLVLHGQRGFTLDNWSCLRSKSKVGSAKQGRQTTISEKSEIDLPLELRGGGGSKCSPSSSSNSTTLNDAAFTEQARGDNNPKTSPPSSSKSKTKRPCFTYGSQQLNLPQTPLKPLKKSRKKPPSTEFMNDSSVVKSAITEMNRLSSVKNETTIVSTNYDRNLSNSEDIEIGSNSDTNNDDEGDVAVSNVNAMNSLQRTAISKNASFPTHRDGDMKDHDVVGMPPLKNVSTSTQPTLHVSIAASDICSEEESGCSSADVTPNKLSLCKQQLIEQRDNQHTVGWGGVKPATAFGGEVFFTQVLPRWCPPPSSNGKTKRKSSARGKPITEPLVVAQYSDDMKECVSFPPKDNEKEEEDPEIATTAGGVHHPKFFLLFETSGSLVVIVSTSNLTPQQALEGSWVQRFEPKQTSPRLKTNIRSGARVEGGDGGSKADDFIDYGMPSDFGAILVDFLTKQSDAAVSGEMLPDVFLRRYVPGLSSGLNALAGKYRFSDAQVHLVSTVPGDYVSSIPKSAHRDPMSTTYKPRISYGPQRVSFILSRILNSSHIRSARIARAAFNGRVGGCRLEADTSWFPPSLVSANDRLVIQPTSLGGNWTRGDLEVVVRSYLRPHWESPCDTAGNGGTPIEEDTGPLNVCDIVWPSMESIDALKKRQNSSIQEKVHPELSAASSITNHDTVDEDSDGEGRGHAPLFLSSISFAKLDRSCISRLSLFTHVLKGMPHSSSSIHFKSICRLLRLTTNKKNMLEDNNLQPSETYKPSKEYLSWFMLTSACLSRGAQGRPTPHSDPATDSMSYMNFELGILFCSRLMGDNIHDRIYVSDPDQQHTTIIGCQCGKGSRWYKSRFLHNGNDGGGGGNSTNNGFLDSVRKVHLPVPYRLRPIPYRTDPDSDLMDYTPYMHDIPAGTECVGNMKLTPFGRRKMDAKTSL